MRRAPHSQPNNLSAPTMHYFTPDSFFATNNKPVHAKNNGLVAAMTTPKRPPKLMDQRITIATKNDGRRNSQPKQQPEFGQITPLNVVMPQLIKSPQQPRQTQQQQMIPTMAMGGGRGGGGGKGTTLLVKKETAKQMETTTTIFATPPRRTAATSNRQPQQQSSFRREHSASIVIPSRRTLSATFMRYTPPTTIGMERGHSEVASLFAGSKSIESPSAKSLPLPPSHWLESNRQQLAKQEIVEETMGEESDDNAAPSSAETNNENFIPGTWSPPTATTIATTINGNKSPSGIRIHPLHLISAAVMSS